MLTSSGGSLTLVGTGGTSDDSGNDGVFIWNDGIAHSIDVFGAGNMSITGYGGGYSAGVQLASGSKLTTDTGSLEVIGESGSQGFWAGIFAQGATIESSGG
ncbi:MAG: hypothetical protein IPP41_14005, partial [Rhodocyclaceae bacterium]|nr:hypothetical protein [Rhodocyclaceae bacterium]